MFDAKKPTKHYDVVELENGMSVIFRKDIEGLKDFLMSIKRTDSCKDIEYEVESYLHGRGLKYCSRTFRPYLFDYDVNLESHYNHSMLYSREHGFLGEYSAFGVDLKEVDLMSLSGEIKNAVITSLTRNNEPLCFNSLLFPLGKEIEYIETRAEPNQKELDYYSSVLEQYQGALREYYKDHDAYIEKGKKYFGPLMHE